MKQKFVAESALSEQKTNIFRNKNEMKRIISDIFKSENIFLN